MPGGRQDWTEREGEKDKLFTTLLGGGVSDHLLCPRMS